MVNRNVNATRDPRERRARRRVGRSDAGFSTVVDEDGDLVDALELFTLPRADTPLVRCCTHQSASAREDRPCYHSRDVTGSIMRPMAWHSTMTSSPASIGPTPSGVPVA